MALTYSNVTLGGITGPVGPTGSSYTIASGAGLNYPVHNGGTWSTTAITQPAPKVLITEGDITLDGLSLRNFMETVQERLAILTPNPKLEKDFEQLRALREQYQTLEKELLEKAKTWDTLKNTDQ